MSSALEELPPDVRNTPEEVNKVFDNEFADRLVGHGRVFGRGVGVKPSMVGYSSSSSGSRGRASTTVELEMIKAKLEESEAARERMFAQSMAFQESVTAQLEELRAELSRRPPAMSYNTFKADYCREHGIPWMSPLSFPPSDLQPNSTHPPEFMPSPPTRPAVCPTPAYTGVPQMSENVPTDNTLIRPTVGMTMPFRGESQLPEDSNDETQLG